MNTHYNSLRQNGMLVEQSPLPQYVGDILDVDRDFRKMQDGGFRSRHFVRDMQDSTPCPQDLHQQSLASLGMNEDEFRQWDMLEYVVVLMEWVADGCPEF